MKNQFLSSADGLLSILPEQQFYHLPNRHHNDLKLLNILLRDNSAPLLIDLDAMSPASNRKHRIYTIGYEPPEHYQGKDIKLYLTKSKKYFKSLAVQIVARDPSAANYPYDTPAVDIWSYPTSCPIHLNTGHFLL